MNVATVAYLAAGLAYAAMFALLITGLRSDPLGHRLTLAAFLSAVWLSTIAYSSYRHEFSFYALYVSEAARDWGWLLVLLELIEAHLSASAGRRLRLLVYLLPLVAVAALMLTSLRWINPLHLLSRSGLIVSFLIFVLIEQIYRNATQGARKWLKLLLLGVGAQFAFELFVFAQSELLGVISDSALIVRAVVAAAAVPVLMLSVRRSSGATAAVFVSRHIVFYTSALSAVGLYLCAMAVGGYYVRIVSGHWGEVLQLGFLAGALLVLVTLMLSASVRRRLKVFISKHFYSNKYDYRVEWLRFVKLLSAGEAQDVHRIALSAVSQVLASPAGALYVCDGAAARLAATWDEDGAERAFPPLLAGAHDMLSFLEKRGWIIDLNEYRNTPANYDNISVPDSLLGDAHLRIVSPILQADRLTGVLLLHSPPPPFELTYEDRDLLVTMGRHVATHLAQHEADRKLTENQQFAAFSKLTTFMMHDLKNSVAQLQLVSVNAARHKHDPEFIDDAVQTIDNAVARITRLMEQMRSDESASRPQRVSLADMIRTAANRCSDRAPVPFIMSDGAETMIEADPERVISALEHLIRNAQDATPPEGKVELDVQRRGSDVLVSVADNGAGMDESFLQERLFRPFDSTKGAAGMGIGAYQVREYVKALGGSISVRSRRGEGTCFEILLPAVDGGVGSG